MHWICVTLLSVCPTQVDASVANVEELTVSLDGVFGDESTWVKVAESESLATVVMREPRSQQTTVHSMPIERFSNGWDWYYDCSDSKLKRTPEDERTLDDVLRRYFGETSSWVDLIDSDSETAILIKGPAKQPPSNHWIIADELQNAGSRVDADSIADRHDPWSGGALSLDADSRSRFREYVSSSGDISLWNLRH